MAVDHEIIVWALNDMARLLRHSDLGGHAPVSLVESEVALTPLLPPNKSPLLYLVDANALRLASVAFLSLLVSRPSTWPPFVFFGTDRDLLENAVGYNPNSRVLVGPTNAAEQLSAVAAYWVRQNYPMG